MIKLQQTKLLTAPLVRIPYGLYAQILALVRGTDAAECQWYHRIIKTFDGWQPVYTLEGIYIPKQTVTGGTVDSPSSSWLALWNELKEEHTVDGVTDINRLNEIFSSMHCWSHSHVNMATTPSSTDEKQYLEWIQGNLEQKITDPIMMMIVNRSESVYIRLLDIDQGIEIENPAVEIIYPQPDLTYVQNAIANKIQKAKLAIPNNFFLTHNLKAPSSSSKQKNTELAPSFIESEGRRLLGSSDMLLTKVATQSNCATEAIQLANRLVRAFTKAPRALEIFRLLLIGEYEKVPNLSITPKDETMLFANLTTAIEGWTDILPGFYSTVGAASLIEAAYSKSLNKRYTAADRESEITKVITDLKSDLAGDSREAFLALGEDPDTNFSWFSQ